MHLGLIGRRGPDSFQSNIGDCLRRMGHQVTHLGLGRPERGGRVVTRVAELAMTAAPGLEDRWQRSLVRSARESGCDAVINTYGGLSQHTVAAFRRDGLPVALWFPDAVCNLGRQRMLLAPYTALFFKEPLLVRRLRDTLNLPVWYLPEGCNPRLHRPIGESASRRALVVVGNSYPSRVVLLRRLHEAGIPLRIYGNPPAKWLGAAMPPGLHAGYPVFGEQKARVFREAAAVLNNLHPAEMHGVNTRVFEATASGGAVLCERRPALGELFDLDSEVVPFTDFAELLDKARQLLDDPGLTRKIGDMATRRAHADHTLEQRLPIILEKLT